MHVCGAADVGHECTAPCLCAEKSMCMLRDTLYKSNQITFTVTSQQHMCLGE